MARLSEDLVGPYHAFAILTGASFAAAVLWPETAPAALDTLMRGPFLAHAVAFLIGFLGLQIGEAERGYGAYRVVGRAGRLTGLVAFALCLVLPFLFVHRVETGLPWTGFSAILALLLAYGLFWALVGHGLAVVVHCDGLRFVLKYGSLLAIAFVPLLAQHPVSPFPALDGLWSGTAAGWWGLALYGALDAGILGAWAWATRRSSNR